MKMSCGVDIVEVGRIRRSLQNPRFLERCFSPEERRCFEERSHSPETVAAHFAAKEAFGKLLGRGLSGFALSEVSVLHDERGAPYYRLTGEAARLAKGLELSLSLSHDGGMAIAMATALEP